MMGLGRRMSKLSDLAIWYHENHLQKQQKIDGLCSCYLSGCGGYLPVVLGGLRSHGSRHRSVLRFWTQHLLSVQLIL